MFKKGKNIFSLLVIILSVFMNSSITTVMAADNSTDYGDQFITSASLKNLTTGEEPVTSSNINDSLQATWNFAIPQGKGIKAGDTMTVKIPEALVLNNDISGVLIKDSKTETVIANLAATRSDKKIRLTFTADAQAADNVGNISGSFQLTTGWDKNFITTQKDVPIVWTSNGSTSDPNTGTTINVDTGTGPAKNEVLYKWGSYEETGSNKILWQVRVNYEGNSTPNAINNAVYKDIVGANQKLVPDSIHVYNVKYRPNSYNYDLGSELDFSVITDTSDSGFNVNFGNISSAYFIEYETEQTDNGVSFNYSNTGILNGNNQTLATIPITSPDNNASGSANTSENTASVTGTKKWVGGTETDRPNSIQIDLYANDEKVQSTTTDQSKNWQFSFTNLKRFSANGTRVVYSVKEANVPENYNSSVTSNGEVTNNAKDHPIYNYTITNTYKSVTPPVETTDYKVSKVWDDNNNSDKIRPESVNVQLLDSNDKVVDTATLNTKNNWTYTWKKLTKADYHVAETKVDGYSTSIKASDNAAVITNTHKVTPVPKKTSFTVTKKWSGDTNASRPKSVSVQLTANGKAYGDPVTLNSDNNWTYTWNDLSKDSKYSVTEQAVSGYTANVDVTDNQHAIITNTKKPSTVVPPTTKSFTVKKVWNDQDNKDGLRPNEVTVHLLVDGKASAKVVLNAKNNWEYTWKDLAADKKYSVSEDQVPDYLTNIDLIDDNNVQIVNTHSPKVTPAEPAPKPDPDPNPGEPKDPNEPKEPETPIDPETPTIPTEPSVPTTPEEPKNPETPTTPVTPETPVVPDNPLLPDPDPDPEIPSTPSTNENHNPLLPRVPDTSTNQTNVPHQNSHDTLPQTGSPATWLYTILGLILLDLIGIFILNRATKKA
ncbi:Cna B-type domain-containing protein [Companilactobacillus suantsaicola]|uniref:Cna B-type domain-containing protein n=1 Tax=Companilactobacillus suantsaicola TaxID=2487723 RepID=A0A4Z0JM33_9LACO|nr:Cna B-type domain-containing protein [Companilactobacillus suantsaicola]TGD23173.1 Cna B-type domain-containing protein [Companilactobacillus suantsaicola]